MRKSMGSAALLKIRFQHLEQWKVKYHVRGKTMDHFEPFPAALMSLNNVTADSGMKALKDNLFKYTIGERLIKGVPTQDFIKT